jgi:hypothetical protein
MATAAAIARAKRAIDGSPAGTRIRDKVIQRARDALCEPDAPPPKDSPNFLNTTRELLGRLQALGMAWLFERNDLRYVERAKRELSLVCDFPDWNPSHFLDTAEMTHAVAIGYDWFYDRLTKSEKKRFAAAIIDKGLRPGWAQLTGTPKPAWPTQTTNWNIVCNAGLMIGALAVADEQDELPRKVFLRCLNSVPTGFRGYSPDGSWDEGPGYWGYATEYAAYLLSALKTAINKEFGLAHLPGFRNGGLFRLYAEGSALGERIRWKLFNFSDGEEERRGSWCLRWLSLRFNEPMFNWIALKDGQTKPMDLLWFSPKEPDSDGIARNVVFRGGANVAMLRGGWDRISAAARFRPWAQQPDSGEVFLGIRAGANSRENAHGQLDLGSFVLDALQVRWATDIASVDAHDGYYGDYSLPGYFDIDQGRRFRYYRTGTVGHNTLVINGFNQPLGVHTEIIGFRDASPDLVVVVVDLTAAYPDCLRLRRGFALIQGRHVLIVDEVTPKDKMTVAWQMHTKAQASPGMLARLAQKSKDGQTKEFFVRILEPKDTEFTVEEARVTQPGEAPNTDISKLAATLPGVAEPTRISVYLSAKPEAIDPLPAPLSGPLWTWLEWSGKRRRRGYPL